MSRQWKRRASLIVGSTTVLSSGDDVSAGLRIQFEISANVVGTPNIAHITITNLTDTTAKAMMAEFKPVELQAVMWTVPTQRFSKAR